MSAETFYAWSHFLEGIPEWLSKPTFPCSEVLREIEEDRSSIILRNTSPHDRLPLLHNCGHSVFCRSLQISSRLKLLNDGLFSPTYYVDKYAFGNDVDVRDTSHFYDAHTHKISQDKYRFVQTSKPSPDFDVSDAGYLKIPDSKARPYEKCLMHSFSLLFTNVPSFLVSWHSDVHSIGRGRYARKHRTLGTR